MSNHLGISLSSYLTPVTAMKVQTLRLDRIATEQSLRVNRLTTMLIDRHKATPLQMRTAHLLKSEVMLESLNDDFTSMDRKVEEGLKSIRLVAADALSVDPLFREHLLREIHAVEVTTINIRSIIAKMRTTIAETISTMQLM